MIHTQSSVASEAAQQIAADAVAHARMNGWEVAACVTDAAGNILTLIRMDGAAPPIAEFAQDKAYTAATMKKSTLGFADRMTSSPSLLAGLSTRPRLLAWGGGLPILKDGEIVGGIGVSGAKDEEDIECATAALEKAGFEAGA